MTAEDLYKYADSHNIAIFKYDVPYQSLSVCIDGTYAIATTDAMTSSTGNEKICLAHELGHCETGSFYNEYTPFDIRNKHERTADKWAVEKLVTADELHDAVCMGYTEMWELAEYFDIPQEFMQKIVCYYEGLEW
ncbi:MAG: ImmA/IrrE family metallo-endopeptidase [Oscillospiraceae bacterium]